MEKTFSDKGHMSLDELKLQLKKAGDLALNIKAEIEHSVSVLRQFRENRKNFRLNSPPNEIQELESEYQKFRDQSRLLRKTLLDEYLQIKRIYSRLKQRVHSLSNAND